MIDYGKDLILHPFKEKKFSIPTPLIEIMICIFSFGIKLRYFYLVQELINCERAITPSVLASFLLNVSCCLLRDKPKLQENCKIIFGIDTDI